MSEKTLPLILNTEEVAKILGISGQTVRKECATGGLPAVRVGRRWFIPRDKFFEFVNGGDTANE